MYQRLQRSRKGNKTVDPDTVPMGNSYVITTTEHLGSKWYTCHGINKAIAIRISDNREVVSFYSTPTTKRSEFTEKQIRDIVIENEIDHGLEARHAGWELRYDLPMRPEHVQTKDNPKPF